MLLLITSVSWLMVNTKNQHGLLHQEAPNTNMKAKKHSSRVVPDILNHLGKTEYLKHMQVEEWVVLLSTAAIPTRPEVLQHLSTSILPKQPVTLSNRV